MSDCGPSSRAAVIICGEETIRSFSGFDASRVCSYYCTVQPGQSQTPRDFLSPLDVDVYMCRLFEYNVFGRLALTSMMKQPTVL